jgi:hypothetical protein
MAIPNKDDLTKAPCFSPIKSTGSTENVKVQIEEMLMQSREF